MKSYLILFITLLSLGFLTAAEKVDGIVAVVGDSVILSSELDAYLFVKINQMGLKPDAMETDIMRRDLLSELVEGKVLLVNAEKDTNITVSQDEIDREVGRRIQGILSQHMISMEELEKLIAKEQGITLTKFKREIGSQIRQEFLKQKVQQLYVATASVNRSDVEAFFNEYKDSLPALGESILLSKIEVNLSASKEVREKAYSKIISIKEMLDNGEDFSELAKLHSDGPNASQGGVLGFVSKGSLSELTFEEKIFSLKPGETSAPFETRLGFHIVTILGRKDQAVNVQQIFVNTSPSEESVKDAVAKLDSIKINSRTVDEFSKAVTLYSTDEVSKAQKGVTKWMTMSELDPKVKGSFDTLVVGNLSSPLRNGNILTLFRIHDIQENRKLTLADDWNNIAQIAQRINSQKKLRELVSKWQKETFIDIRL